MKTFFTVKNIMWLVVCLSGTDHDLNELRKSRLDERVQRLSMSRVRKSDESQFRQMDEATHQWVENVCLC